jgi:hypothetical protein
LSPYSFEYGIPKEYKTYYQCVVYITEYTWSFRFSLIPPKFIDYELSKLIAKRSPENYHNIPKKFRDLELTLIAWNSTQYKDSLYKAIPFNIKTNPLFYNIAIETHPYVIRDIPVKELTEDHCRKAADLIVYSIHGIPKSMKKVAECISREKIALNIENVRNVPVEFTTYEDWFLYVTTVKCWLDIPKKFRKTELYIAGIKFGNSHLFKYLSDKDKTQELCDKAFEDYPINVEFIPKRFMTRKMLIMSIVYSFWDKFSDMYTDDIIDELCEESPGSIRYLPIDKITPERCATVVKKDYHNFTYIPTLALTPANCLAAFNEDKRIEKYLTGKYNDYDYGYDSD